MIITLSQIREQFDIWNKKAFNNELPVPHFELMQTRRMLGQFCPRKVMGEYTYKIRISTFYDRPMAFYIDTIVHEMLHYWIKYKGIKDTSSHGREWKRRAQELSNKFGLTITRTNPAGGGVSDAVIEKKNERRTKYEYAFVCKMRDGIHYGVGIVPSSKVHLFASGFNNWRAVESYKVVKAPWAETYHLRHLRTRVGVGYISKKEYDDLLKNKVLDY